MVLIVLFLAGCIAPMAASSPRALAAVALAGISAFALALVQRQPEGDTTIIATVGVLTAGLLLGAVGRALMLSGVLAQDRAIRRDLPRELPPRYR